ncbi:hypothetical protein EDD80_10172 [Anseongella ginsenosidimutans]|uniref:DUF4157 domain-containing protein n=1 Tax=Anseongella ginsenosidimutans TaxID=496056 RepID=A0A4R3KW96_9SPHI|nr:hypothetical protein [Anseongella ginsenosidimutans]QEC51420.1 hypothetical protein FRZ59_03005 [Anseongella ginsenosidimutans]TCS89875.1 hypothetical protein EDD80_10172 [Anseongella ginsenosidimutans]
MIIVSKWFLYIFTFAFADAMALFPFIILRSRALNGNRELIMHERIHLRQQAEMLVIFFYLWYLTEYLLRRLRGNGHMTAYLGISFEREARAHARNPAYLASRKFWAFLAWI